MEQSVKFRLGIKIWFCFFEVLAIVIIISLIFDKHEFNLEKICAISLIALLAIVGVVYTIYLFSYKIIIRSEDFLVRKFFITRSYKISEITNVEYKRIAFGDYTYVLCFGKKKVEVSQMLNNKTMLDKYLDEQGVFKRYPRINI